MFASSSKRAFSSTHDHDFLAAADRVDEQVHQRRLAAGAVDRHLDGQHRRVEDRLAHELHHGLERLERLVQEQVAGAHPLEHRLLRGRLAGQAGSNGRKRSAGACARWVSSFIRTRLTGPLTL
jgi:hypothetical protein